MNSLHILHLYINNFILFNWITMFYYNNSCISLIISHFDFFIIFYVKYSSNGILTYFLHIFYTPSYLHWCFPYSLQQILGIDIFYTSHFIICVNILQCFRFTLFYTQKKEIFYVDVDN